MSVSRREFLAGSVGVLGVSNLVPADAGVAAADAQTRVRRVHVLKEHQPPGLVQS